MKEEFVHRVIEKYKSDDAMTIPIYGEVSGQLKPFTKMYSSEYVSLVCKWRKENELAFANRFVGSEENTKNWIEKVLLPRKDRILFMVHGPDDTAIGHIGLSTFNFENDSCEIDNVVRGVKGRFNGIMHHAARTIMSWGRYSLGVRNVYLRVLSDNKYAIKFYEKLGFSEQSRIPLYKEELDGMTIWEYREGETKEPDKFYIYMKR